MNTLRADFKLDFDGKQLPCTLNINAFRILTQKFGVKLDGLDKYMSEDPMTALPSLAYCGAINAAMRKGKEFKYGFEQFCAILLDTPESLEVLSEALLAAFGEDDSDSGNV